MIANIFNEENRTKLYGGIALFVITMILILNAVFTVEQYEQAVITTAGKATRQEGPGLGFKVPFVQSVHRMRTDLLKVEPETKANTYTADNQEIDIQWMVFYRLPVDKVMFVYENAQDYRGRLFNLANDRLKSEMGKVKLEHFAERRGEIRDLVKTSVASAALVLGLEVTDFQFTDVSYTPAFRGAVEKASVAKAGVETREWERQQEIKTADKNRIVAEGVANAAREKAKGEADAIDSVSKAEARAMQVKGEAQAKAMEAQAQALARNPQLVEMKKAEQWNGALPVNMYAGAPMPFLRMDSAK